jgi:inner membrane protein
MASIGHVAIALAAQRLHRRRAPSRWPSLAGALGWSALSMLPDLDVIAFSVGIPYGAPWGHRGATHSLGFALLVGFSAYVVALELGRGCGEPARGRHRSALATAALVAAVVASHGLADSLTDGGRGAALLWPFSDQRFFAPWRPIPVAPIGFDFVSADGLRVAAVELLLFAPFFGYGLWPRKAAPRLRAAADP